MPQNRHFGAGSDTMQQVHGAGMKRNQLHIQYIVFMNISLNYVCPYAKI